MLYRVGPTAQHTQDCPIFFIQLNYVHNDKRNKVLPPYVKLLCHKVASGIILPLNQSSHARQTLRGRCWAVGPALQSNSSNCLVLIPQVNWGNVCLVLEKAMIQQSNTHKIEYESMFDTCQKKTYLLRPSTACCTESWCQSVVVM